MNHRIYKYKAVLLKHFLIHFHLTLKTIPSDKPENTQEGMLRNHRSGPQTSPSVKLRPVSGLRVQSCSHQTTFLHFQKGFEPTLQSRGNLISPASLNKTQNLQTIQGNILHHPTEFSNTSHNPFPKEDPPCLRKKRSPSLEVTEQRLHHLYCTRCSKKGIGYFQGTGY